MDRESRPVFHRPELDILRFGAFLMVFFCHAFFSAPESFVTRAIISVGARGVDLFFALSAYLITEILLREQRATGNISVRRFYVRRILRISPLYYTFLLLVYFFGQQKNFPATKFILYLTFLANWIWPLGGVGTGGIGIVAGVLWSVSTEEQFYALWPLVVRAKSHLRIPVCIGIVAASITWRLCMFLAHQETINGGTFGRLDSIAAGAMLAFLLQGRALDLSRSRAWALLLIGALAMVNLVPILKETLLAAGCVAVLVAVMSIKPRSRPLEYLGKISYGLYVTHAMCLVMASRFIPEATMPLWWARTFLAFALTVLVASASYRWLESPFLRLKDRLSMVRRSTVVEMAA